MAKSVNRMLTRVAGKAGKVALQDLNPLDVLREYCAYRKATEQEITRREEIKARRDTAIAEITAQRELIQLYFESRFSERAYVLTECFNVLQRGLTEKNEKAVDAALTSIVEIAKDSPFKDFESFCAARMEGAIIEI